MSMRARSLIGALLLFGQSANSSTVTVGAYAVANHGPCGVSNIPGTIRELDKFFADPSFAAFGQKNFYWKDSRVRQAEWTKETDYISSSETTTGFDGADASLLSYIASHGVTSNGLYRALAGSKNNGGCYIATTSLELGNNASKYSILSTCQGLKIGNGDNPTSSGENPSKTWKNAAKGLNCILGYSNNMADKDAYGIYLLAKLKNSDTTLADAFMSSSEAVSRDNVPAVLCFGETQEDAANFIRENKTFDDTSRSNATSAFVYRKSSKADNALKSIRSSFSSEVTLAPAAVNLTRVSKAFLGTSINADSAGKDASGNSRYTSDAGNATFDVSTNLLSIKNNTVALDKLGDVPSLEESTEIARNALQASGLIESHGQMFVSGSSEDVLGGEDGTLQVLARKIQFRQQLSGFQTLGQAGTVEVTVGAGGVIIAVQASLFKVTSTSKRLVQAAKLQSSTEDFEATAIQNVAEKVPGGAFKVVQTNFGYNAGNFFEVNLNPKAVVEVTVEATVGGFSRRYIETIAL